MICDTTKQINYYVEAAKEKRECYMLDYIYHPVPIINLWYKIL